MHAVLWNQKKYYFLCNWLEGNQNENNCLVSNLYEIFRAFLPPISHGEKCGKFKFVVKIAHKALVLILIYL